MTCLDLKRGTVIWQKQIERGPYFASVLAGDDKLYFLNSSGVCTVIDSRSRDGSVIATNRLKGEFRATPAISGGVIFIRSQRRLYAIQSK